MTRVDEGIRAVRAVREKISAEFNNDPEKLVKHYIEQQKLHQSRLLQPVAVKEEDAADDASRLR